MKYGFTDAEFEEVKAASLAGIQAVVDQADNRPPAALAGAIVDSLADDKVFVSPADALAVVKRLLADLKKSDCEQALRKAWDSQDVQIWVDGNLRIDGDGASRFWLPIELAKPFPSSLRPTRRSAGGRIRISGRPVRSSKRIRRKTWISFQAVFANNVRVNVKRTSYEKNVVRVAIRFGGGLLEMPVNKPGLRAVCQFDVYAGRT